MSKARQEIIVTIKLPTPGAPGVKHEETYRIKRIQQAAIRPIGPRSNLSYFKAIPTERPWEHWNVQVTGVPATIDGDEFGRFQGQIEIIENAGRPPH